MTGTAAPPFAIGSVEWPGLSKLVEEAGEVMQVVGKLMANGGQRVHWDGSDLVARLTEELADLSAAIGFVIANNPTLSPLAVAARVAEKRERFQTWHDRP